MSGAPGLELIRIKRCRQLTRTSLSNLDVQGEDGRRYWIRTNDLHDVNVAL